MFGDGISIMGWMTRGLGALGISALATVGGYMFGYDEEVAVDLALGGYSEVSSSIDAIFRVSAAGIANDDKTIPLNEEARASLSKNISELESQLIGQMQVCATTDDPECLPWSVAQIAVAVGRDNPATAQLLKTYLDATLDPSCSCWRHFGNRHVAASAWAISSLAATGQTVTAAQLKALLDLQTVTGWWPMFPAPYNFDYASTYATLMSMVALNVLIRNDLVPDGMDDAVADARTRAIDWLRLVRQDRGLWADYPHSDYYSVTSVGLSGVVLYVLHQTEAGDDGTVPEWLEKWGRDWLDEISSEIPEPTSENASLARINAGGGQVLEDTTRHYKLPGTVLGIAATYADATPRQRVKALRWLEHALNDGEHIASKQVLKQYWLAAETLIALRMLQRHVTVPDEPAETS